MDTKIIFTAAFAGMTAASAIAGPLDLAHVSRDAKWVVHLDMERFRKTAIGSHFVDKVLQPKIDGTEKVKEMNLSINLQNISALTAFGPAFEKNGEGVLLIRTSADVKHDLDTLAGLSSLSGGQALTLAHLNPYPLYSFQSNVFIAPNIANMVVVAKSKEQIENARKVLSGKGESLAGSKSFSDYPAGKNAFFFLGMVEGLEESTRIPAQAQVLKETRGGRLVLGESGDRLFANLVFKGKDEESATRIQQVFQGILALASMSQDNPDITELAKSAKITSEDRHVSINLQFPVAKAIDRIDEKAQ